VNSLQVLEESVSKADETIDCMSVHHVNWKLKVKQARMALRTVIADALLTAAFVVYCGPLEQTMRDGLLSDWLSRCETGNFSFDVTSATGSDLLPASSSRRLFEPSEHYSVEDVAGIADLLPELEVSRMLSDIGSRHNAALIYSCLFYHGPLQRWTLLIDLDNQAEPCIHFLLDHTSQTSNCAFTSGESVIFTDVVLCGSWLYIAIECQNG